MSSVQQGSIPPTLLAAYHDRTAAGKKHFESGGKVCGYFGNGMPIEVAMATGHMPMALMPLPDRPTPHAEEWVNPSFDPQLRLILDQLISGELGFVDLAVAVSQASPDSLVFQSAREILRQGLGGQIPPLHHYSLLGLQSEPVREYGLREIEDLARRLRANSGEEATPSSLKQAIEITNAIRAQWRALDTLRREGRVSGTDALTLIAPSRFMDAKAYLHGITEAVAALRGRSLKGPRLLVISSEALSDSRLHHAIEAGGSLVVAEFDIWGACSATPDIVAGDNPLQSIYEHYYKHVPNRSVYPASARLGWIYERVVQPEIAGVVIHMPPSDRSLGWDYPRLRDYCSAKGKPHLMTRDDATTKEGSAAITQAVTKFVSSIKG
jgi:benzoyl-CoA reductase/2-hydroxyglutaryl-CoA dehydratase subunit BcrC/BadD/HgdB